MPPKNIFKTEKFQRQEGKYSEHCCVPQCSASARFNSVLSFHNFPTDPDRRTQWLVNIRRDHFTISSHTKVCSRHFTSDQLIQPATPHGKRRLVTDAVPRLFEWNGCMVAAPRRSVWERTTRPVEHQILYQVILDCTKLRCQTPSSPLLQSEMYSTYKSHATMKALVGITPHDAVTFVSPLYGGSISDKEIFKQSGIAKMLSENVAVMVDKGFQISDCCKCKVYCPPFLSKQKPAYQVKETQAIARLRVHVERVIRRIKENKLFDGVIPLSHVNNINQLFIVACLLSNYQNKALVKAWAK